jgi:hypothetical protein
MCAGAVRLSSLLPALSFSVTDSAEVQALAKADVMPGVMKFVFEMNQVDVHLHGHLQTKEGMPGSEQPFFCC